MKKLLAALLTVAMLASFAFTGQVFAAESEDPLIVGYMGASAKHGFWKSVADGIQSAFEDAGVEIHVAFTEEDPVQMRSAFDIFLSKGCNFIIDGNASGEKAEVFAQQAKAKGIPYITIECSTESAYSYGMSNQKTGEIAGEYIVELVKEEWGGEVDLVVLLSTFTYIPQLAPRVTGAYDIMCQELDMEGVEVVELAVESDAAICYQLFMDTLTAHPDAEKIVFAGHTDEYALNALNAAAAAGREEHIIATAVDCIDIGIERLKAAHDNPDKYEPLRGDINLAPDTYGAALLDIAQRLHAGEELEKDFITSPYMVTPETVYEVFPD